MLRIIRRIVPSTRHGRARSRWDCGAERRSRPVTHGFRSSFRDWASEQTPHGVMEAALAHTIRNKAEAAYASSELFEERRLLMEAWANYLGNGAMTPTP